MPVKATAKVVRVSPRKMGLVAALVRGRSVVDGLVILEHTPRKAARHLSRVINSAVANAENNHKLTRQQLQIDSILVSPGPVIGKGWRPGSRGHVDFPKHRTSHVTVLVEQPKTRVPSATKTKAAKPEANKEKK